MALKMVFLEYGITLGFLSLWDGTQRAIPVYAAKFTT